MRRNSGSPVTECLHGGEVSPISAASTFRADSFQEGAMKTSRQGAILLVQCRAGWPAAGCAADNSLVVVLGGEAYDERPKFEVDFDGKPLGEGAVAAAIDTAADGRFADATDKTR